MSQKELSAKIKVISRKGWTKDLINEFRTLNATKFFSSQIFQNCLAFTPAKNYIRYFSGTPRINSRKFSNFARTFVDHHILDE